MLRESRLPMTIACCVLPSMLCARSVSADTIFFDDFDDGNAQDGTPVTWTPSSGTWDASSGDYVATGTIPRVSRVLAHVLGDTSARSQVRVTGNMTAGIALRRSQHQVGYAGQIRANGTVTIARLDGGPVPVELGTSVVPFNPVQQD